MKVSRKTGLVIAVCVQAHAASAQSPVAIVEDVKGQVAGLEAMDYLVSGRTLRLTRDETVVIGYLKSCVRETIYGGTVKIGDKQSTVEAGVIERAKVACDAQGMMATPAQPLDSTGYVVRGGVTASERLPEAPRAPGPQFTLYGSSPLIEAVSTRAISPVQVIVGRTGDHLTLPTAGQFSVPLLTVSRAGRRDFAAVLFDVRNWGKLAILFAVGITGLFLYNIGLSSAHPFIAAGVLNLSPFWAALVTLAVSRKSIPGSSRPLFRLLCSGVLRRDGNSLEPTERHERQSASRRRR